MENQLVLPKLTITRIQRSQKEAIVPRRSRRRTCCLNDIYPRCSSPFNSRESRYTIPNSCFSDNINTNIDAEHKQSDNKSDHDSLFRVKVQSTDDSGPSSISSESPTSSIGEEEDLILSDILDDMNRVPKNRSNSAPTLVRIDSFQDRAMRLMRKRHANLQKNRRRAHSANRVAKEVEVFEPCSPTTTNTLLVPTPEYPDIMFTVINNSNRVDRIVPDNNNNNVSDHAVWAENANETVILTDNNGLRMFTTTKELVRSFELQKQIRKRRANKKTLSFDENLLRR